MLKSNFLDNRLPKRKNDFYSIIVFLIALYSDSHLNAASFDSVWMHGETDLPLSPRVHFPTLHRPPLLASAGTFRSAVLNQTVATVWFSTGRSHLWLTAQYLLRATFTCSRCILIKQGVEAELAAYMNEDVIPHTESSTAWRAANLARFPVLAVEAKRYLSAPLTSMASEPFFSSAAQV